MNHCDFRFDCRLVHRKMVYILYSSCRLHLIPLGSRHRQRGTTDRFWRTAIFHLYAYFFAFGVCLMLTDRDGGRGAISVKQQCGVKMQRKFAQNFDRPSICKQSDKKKFAQ